MPENPNISGAAADTPPPGRFIRWLHGAYFRGDGIRHFLARRTRPAGAAVTIAMGCLAPLMAAYSRGPIYQSFSICFVLFCAGIIWSFARRARLTARRELPRHATVGVSMSYPVRVRNHGRFRIKRAWLMETPPDPRPSATGSTGNSPISGGSGWFPNAGCFSQARQSGSCDPREAVK
jgi:hypothetical protein